LAAGLRLILLHEGGADRRGHHRVLASRHMRQGIAHEVHTAALPCRTDHLRDRLPQPLMRIRDHHPDPGQATAQQVAQELRPESLGLGRTDRHAQRLAATLGIMDTTLSKAQVMALISGDPWLAHGANAIWFGPPGGGKSHLEAGIGLALVEKGYRVLYTRTTDLVQRLQMARRELTLESAIDKLDKYHLLTLDDLAYVTKDQAETSVLFELISARYERRSMLITANQPFGE
jgi:hypothetical protein